MLQNKTWKLHRGDCLDFLPRIAKESVQLVYLDPPFFTQKRHNLRTRDRKKEFSFDDIWASNRDYTEFLMARLEQLHAVLSPTGSVFFHCDRNATHLVRLLLDEVFGPNNFRSEIIWSYRRWSNSRKGLLPCHQTIYYYTKTNDFVFNLEYEDYSPSTNVDQILQQRVRDEHGKAVYRRDESGRVVSNGGKKGVPISDVWDIPYLNPKARERTGYPTQKPLVLLERIIRIASNKHDTLLDPFCGSGTAIVAATMLERNAIGIDLSNEAIDLTETRLQRPVKSKSTLLSNGRDSYRNANEKSLELLQGLDIVPVHRNKGIDAFLKDAVDGKAVPVRVQRTGETIQESSQLLFKASKGKDIDTMLLVAISPDMGCLPGCDDIPPGVEVIDAPALIIARLTKEISSDSRR